MFCVLVKRKRVNSLVKIVKRGFFIVRKRPAREKKLAVFSYARTVRGGYRKCFGRGKRLAFVRRYAYQRT